MLLLYAKLLSITSNSSAGGRGFLKRPDFPLLQRQGIPAHQHPFPQGFSLCCSLPMSQMEMVTEWHLRKDAVEFLSLFMVRQRALMDMAHNLKRRPELGDKLGGLV